MKKERGVTLISLILYVILMTFIVSAVAAITTAFNENLSEIDQDSESSVAFAKFNMYFLNDIKKRNVEIKNSSRDTIELSYRDDEGNYRTTKYSVVSGSLYRDKVKICDKIKDIKVTADKTSGMATIYLKIRNYEKTTVYKLEPKISESESD